MAKSVGNMLDGGAGNDELDGNGGDDTLIGGAGNERSRADRRRQDGGGAGNDVYDGRQLATR